MADSEQRSCGPRIAVLGQGYVGLAVSLAAVSAGMDVVGFDVAEDRIRCLRDGLSPIDNVSDSAVQEALATGRFGPSSDERDLADLDYAVICVPTPLRDRLPDLGHVLDACRLLRTHLRPGATVVLESTCAPGTTADVVAPMLGLRTERRAGHNFHLGFSPERIDPGNPVWGLANTPKVVSGVASCCLDKVSEFYARLVQRIVPVSSTSQAELTKLLENTFRAVNIALVNELSLLTETMGCDLQEVIDAAATKPFGYMPFYPGPGVGGHCLPVDAVYLSWEARLRWGVPLRLVELATEVNAEMPHRVVKLVARRLNEDGLAVAGQRVLMLGMSYKPGSADIRGAPAREVAARLVELGADVRCADPVAGPTSAPDGCIFVEDIESEATEADLVLVTVRHEVFDLDMLALKASRFLDVTPQATASDEARATKLDSIYRLSRWDCRLRPVEGD